MCVKVYSTDTQNLKGAAEVCVESGLQVTQVLII